MDDSGAEAAKNMIKLGEVFEPLIDRYVDYVKNTPVDFEYLERATQFKLRPVNRHHFLSSFTKSSIFPIWAVEHYEIEYILCKTTLTDKAESLIYSRIWLSIINDVPSVFEEALRLVITHNEIININFLKTRQAEINKFENTNRDLLNTSLSASVKAQIADITETYTDVISLLVSSYGENDSELAMNILKGLVNTPINGPESSLMSGVKNLFEIFTRASFGTLAETAHHAKIRFVNTFDLNQDGTISVRDPSGLFRFIRNYNRTEELINIDDKFVMVEKKNNPSAKMHNTHAKCPFADIGVIPDIANIWVRDLELAIEYVKAKRARLES